MVVHGYIYIYIIYIYMGYTITICPTIIVPATMVIPLANLIHPIVAGRKDDEKKKKKKKKKDVGNEAR